MKNRHQKGFISAGGCKERKDELKVCDAKRCFFSLFSSRLRGSVAVALAHIQVAVEGFERKQMEMLVTVCGAQWVGFTLYNP